MDHYHSHSNRNSLQDFGPTLKDFKRPKLSPKAIRRKREWVYITTHPVLFTTGIVALFTGVLFTFTDQEDNAALVQILDQPWQTLWLIAYAVAGLGIVLGFLRYDARYEAAGLVLLAACCLADFYAIIAFRGLEAILGSSMILGLGVGAGFRAWAILTTRL